jgi:arylsulfatase A-like enzyme
MSLILPLDDCYGQPPSKPNIVLIFVDDWAWNGSPVRMNDDMINSAMPLIRMPNLQTLANNGMKFTNAYAGAPQCSPSRVALQTGQSSPRNGFTVFMNDRGSDYYDPNPNYALFPVIACVSDMYIDADAVTIPEALNPLGYACAHFGKWHMRGDPGEEGYIAHDGATTNSEGNQQIPGDPKLMYSLSERSVQFMQEQAGAGQPFYLQISHWAMHEGRECLDETRKKYQRMPEIQAYYREVGETAETINDRQDPAVRIGMGDNLDDCIGSVIQAVKDLGIENNTYILLTIDNGYREPYYPLIQPLHGGKWWLWQGGLRVPMIVTGPGIPAGSVSETYVVNYDFLPTFVEWAGGDPDALEDIDGKSLAGILRGEKPEWDLENRNLYFHYPHYRTSMPHSTMISAGRWKVMHFYEAPDIPMLFNLNNDRGEFRNVAPMYPIKHDMLYREMMSYLNQVGARIPKDNPDYDPAVYQAADEYDKRVLWGPFEGERLPEPDEK